MKRCDWCLRHPLEIEYHDKHWGKPVYDDLALFRMLMLECNQAGLSWTTILKKMDTLLAAYDNFDPHKLITYDEAKITELLHNDGIIKNRLKIKAMIHNAQMYFEIQRKTGSFSKTLWAFVDHKPIINHPQTMDDLCASSDLSDQMSRYLKKEGFKFVGSTTVYAFMQAVGMVNDHLDSCDFK